MTSNNNIRALLARTKHQLADKTECAQPACNSSHSPTASADPSDLTGRSPSSRFDVVSTMPATSSGPSTLSNQRLDTLATNNEGDYRLDAEILLAHVLKKSRSYLHTWPEHEPDQGIIEKFDSLVQRRSTGEPIAYLVGKQEFWSLPITVSPVTLIPRPETELLVELALGHIPKDCPLQIADLGTGSGAVALAIAHERPKCQITATDKSSAALKVACLNANQLGINNITFKESNWFDQLGDQMYDIILANPPYVRENDPYLLQGDLRFEPASALVSGPTGLEAINIIADKARQHLKERGWLLFEHGYDQGTETMELVKQYEYVNITCTKDLSGHDRITSGQYACSQIK